ncbi:hypothetical protein [Collinsella stercoris]|uniref:Uncharacterized protein n=1 Tax=Collinsella stercoris DSM 13279 TaxID=445975 RepID=B6GDW7_9ACTN|nr:hypothetical protein [Collinsella stercoris]EEA89537.1 hypothetical protein COLSTE_02313 [Collinsella stercoris DSM 13279]
MPNRPIAGKASAHDQPTAGKASAHDQRAASEVSPCPTSARQRGEPKPCRAAAGKDSQRADETPPIERAPEPTRTRKWKLSR